MRREKIVSLAFCSNYFLVFCCAGVVAQNMHPNLAVNKFQNGLQQQNFYTVLSSIEERLRNLDNIYSMQLSQTLENKLDMYNRKLESLDTKIIRLEALVMLNLDKISENISTKNFKDDISKTNTYRKMDSLYEGISSRLSYMDRKFETHYSKIQEKLDITMSHLNKIEENSASRGSDMETELSDAIFAIDDLKTTYNVFEGRLYNMTESIYNTSKDSFDLLKRCTTENKKSMNRLHDNIIGNLQYMDNKTSQNLKGAQECNDMLRKMKTELKEDFNSYANKVADMNSDIWKTSGTTEDDLRTISEVVNSTKTEVQNGFRSLAVQIGKLVGKNDSASQRNYEEIDKKMTKTFEKILTNQDVFMDSCHRLQMDEAQIETEISVMLEKLIDMLEKKLASESKDIRSIEKALKSHDSRVNRNLHQANSNIISLFEKYTINSQHLKEEVRQIETNVNALTSLVQKGLDNGFGSTKTPDTKEILEKLNNITYFAKSILTTQGKELEPVINELASIRSSIANATFNCRHSSNSGKDISTKNPSEVGPKVNFDLRKSVLKIFGPPPRNKTTVPLVSKKPGCKQYQIDLRGGVADDCNDDNGKDRTKRKKIRQFINIRNGGNDDYDEAESDTEETENVYETTTLSGIEESDTNGSTEATNTYRTTDSIM